ncbi:hypothetical protein [Microvirga yunnanensis]|uniref:hypothetical protein n=1 Tax=Microvirga yunnanensis TaxID=2953740 RepID=UPI0021CA74AC|nr:hypothetical protein [Microvirga sp. HBU65207]
MFTPVTVQFTHAVAEHACIDSPLVSDLCADDVKQRIMRAYVHLVFRAEDTATARSFVMMRIGRLEVHLIELRRADITPDVPPFWIEVVDWLHQTSIDSIGSYEFSQSELAAAVEMIVGAAQETKTRNISSQNGQAT